MAERSVSRAVVTGPTGVVGSALVRHLIARGVTVFAVIRPDSPRRSTLPAEAVPVLCDLSDLGAVKQLPEQIPGGADAFFHLGWSGAVGADRQNPEMQAKNITAIAAMAITAMRTIRFALLCTLSPKSSSASSASWSVSSFRSSSSFMYAFSAPTGLSAPQ